ncbi:DUF881 domain-containing protein [Oerskovia sp. NPDC060338]|uniref:DUF881 domain-containing protein n=1 Tax=Oerskovia sp. NPDC060338 TaxID=3347100 RepID=UPI00365ADD8B
MTNAPRNDAPATRRPPRVDASMTLLTEVMDRPLDPGYAEAAARRASGQEQSKGPRAWLLVVTLGILLGFVTTTATVDLRAPQGSAIAARQVLEDEITDRRETVDELTARATALSEETEALQNVALSDVDPALLESLKVDGVTNGSIAVTGPGIVVTLKDAPAGLGASDEDSFQKKVQDMDLQHVVNGLWASGAEAIAINGQRLTPLSAVRSAGEAILVDLQPLIGPYRVEAIGDPDTLETAFARSAAQDYLMTISQAWGIQQSRVAQSKLSLPGNGVQRLYYAYAVDSTATGGDEPAGTDSSPAEQESTE